MSRSIFGIHRRERGDILFGPMFFIGIIAAIAIPAYQDYTIRAQVYEGMNLAAVAKATVAESYAQKGKWPANNKEAGLDQPLRGHYVKSVTVNKGTLTIVYGGQANGSLVGRRLTLRPVIDEQQNVVWSCGYHELDGADPASGAASPHQTDIAPKYLPSACRAE